MNKEYDQKEQLYRSLYIFTYWEIPILYPRCYLFIIRIVLLYYPRITLGNMRSAALKPTFRISYLLFDPPGHLTFAIYIFI